MNVFDDIRPAVVKARKSPNTSPLSTKNRYFQKVNVSFRTQPKINRYQVTVNDELVILKKVFKTVMQQI